MKYGHEYNIPLIMPCRVDEWEVFALQSQLDDEWGWGRSQRSGESGLIPLKIMEDVVGG